MTAATALPEAITDAPDAQYSVDAYGLRALAKQLASRLSWGGFDPPFSRGLGDDFTPDVAEALTAASAALSEGM